MAERKKRRKATAKVDTLFVVSILKDTETGGHVGHPTAFFEVNPAHPGGQVLVAGPLPVKVGRTAALAAAIREEKVREVDPDEAEDLHGEYHDRRLARRREAAVAAADDEALSMLPPWARAIVEDQLRGVRTTSVPRFDKDLEPTRVTAPSPSTEVQDNDEGANTDNEPDDADDVDDDTEDDEDDEEEDDLPKPVNPNTSSKEELLAEAKKRGVTSVNEGMTKKEIADEINANLTAEG
jgi:hypothetical protein